MIESIRSLLRRSNKTQKTSKRRKRRLGFVESLEDRRVLAALTDFMSFEDVDWTTAGVSGIGRHGTIQTQEGVIQSNGAAEITIDGVTGTVTNAFLIWHGIDQSSFNGSGFYDNASIDFAGSWISGQSATTNDTAGWGPGGSQAFYVDVTSRVTGNGTYQLDRLSSKPGHSANGASLIVIYDDGDTSNDRDLSIMLGNQSRTTPISASAVNYNGGNLVVQLHVADGQSFQDTGLNFSAASGEVDIKTISDTTTMLDGNSTPSMGLSRASNGNLWDIHNFDLSSEVNSKFSAGASIELTMTQLTNGNDSLKWVGFIIDQPSDGSLSGNLAPTADDQTYNSNEDTQTSGQLSGSDPEGDTLTYNLVQVPRNGQLSTFSSISGRFVYTPNTNFNGIDTFTYNVSDGTNSSATATVSLNVSAVNDAPSISDQSFTGPEGSLFRHVLTAFDVDGDQLSFSTVTAPSNGSWTLLSNGAINYTPNAGFIGTDTATVSVSDGQLSSQAQISLVVEKVNDAPVAKSETVTTSEDALLNSSVTATDTDGDTLTYTLVNTVEHGSLTFRPDGTYSYRPSINYNGSDSFSFTASDGTATSNTAVITLDITPVNDRPSAAINLFSLDEDTSSSGQLVGTDIDGDDLTFALTVAPSNGTATVNSDGTFTYTPNTDFFGTDEFKYSVFDGALYGFSDGTARFSVANVNDAPVAEDDSYEVQEDGRIDLELPVSEFSFLSEPGEYVGGGQTLSYDTSNANFFAYRNSNNSYVGFNVRTAQISDYWRIDFAAPSGQTLTEGTYTGATRYPFQDSTDPGLTISGQHRGYNTSIGEFTITQANYAADGTVENFAATFWQASYSTAPRTTGEIKYNFVDGGDIGSVLSNDTDADNDDLTSSIVALPQHGALTFNSDGTFSYVPNADFSGTDEFTYRASDGTFQSNIATVTIDVLAQNDAPVANSSDVSTNEDTASAGQFTATDIDGDQLTFRIIDGPTNGTVSLGQGNAFTYTPNENYFGADSFTFVANDGTVDSNVATVDVSVASVNDAPIADDANVSTSEDTFLAGPLTGSDVEGDAITFHLVSGAADGIVTVSRSGSFTYTPDADFNGTDRFVFRTNDGAADSAPATIDITVTAVNDAPVADDASASTSEDTLLAGPLTGSDVDSDALTFHLVGGAANGIVTVSRTGSFTYTPDDDFNGSDRFVFRTNDGTADSAPATIDITVTAVNDAPVAEGFSVTIDENTPSGTSVGSVVASDVDNVNLTYTAVGGSGSTALAVNSTTGEVTVADASQLDFESATQFVIDVQVSDGELTDLAQVVVNLNDLVDTVDIDVNDDANKIKLTKKKIKVAILSTAHFDATTAVDVSSLTFGATGDEDSLDVHRRRGPWMRLEDVNGDGLLDLIARFVTKKTGLDVNSTDAVLKGMLYDGTSFEFSDEVIVKKGRRR